MNITKNIVDRCCFLRCEWSPAKSPNQKFFSDMSDKQTEKKNLWMDGYVYIWTWICINIFFHFEGENRFIDDRSFVHSFVR